MHEIVRRRAGAIANSQWCSRDAQPYPRQQRISVSRVWKFVHAADSRLSFVTHGRHPHQEVLRPAEYLVVKIYDTCHIFMAIHAHANSRKLDLFDYQQFATETLVDFKP